MLHNQECREDTPSCVLTPTFNYYESGSMFRQAFAKAKHFTKPVVAAAKTLDGKCISGIACFVVINSDGWILTAYHILETLTAIRENQLETRAYFDAVAANEAEGHGRPQSLGPRFLGNVQHCAFWWGSNVTKLVDAGGIKEIDLGIGRLDPFDPNSVTEYPVIKNTVHGYDCGASLCKFGYPFFEVPITWDSATNSFSSGPSAINFPLFPLEGILTRFVRDPANDGKRPYSLAQIETSSPGLRGQSGGPIVDRRGRLWGIQTTTKHLPLGFEPEFERDGKKQHQSQFLNVGLGVHGETILGLLKEAGASFELSSD
jgi:hypothetical protein